MQPFVTYRVNMTYSSIKHFQSSANVFLVGTLGKSLWSRSPHLSFLDKNAM